SSPARCSSAAQAPGAVTPATSRFAVSRSVSAELPRRDRRRLAGTAGRTWRAARPQDGRELGDPCTPTGAPGHPPDRRARAGHAREAAHHHRAVDHGPGRAGAQRARTAGPQRPDRHPVPGLAFMRYVWKIEPIATMTEDELV